MASGAPIWRLAMESTAIGRQPGYPDERCTMIHTLVLDRKGLRVHRRGEDLRSVARYSSLHIEVLI